MLHQGGLANHVSRLDIAAVSLVDPHDRLIAGVGHAPEDAHPSAPAAPGAARRGCGGRAAPLDGDSRARAAAIAGQLGLGRAHSSSQRRTGSGASEWNLPAVQGPWPSPARQQEKEKTPVRGGPGLGSGGPLGGEVYHHGATMTKRGSNPYPPSFALRLAAFFSVGTPQYCPTKRRAKVCTLR